VTDVTDTTPDESDSGLRERFFHADEGHDPEEENVQRFGVTFHPVVFPLSLVLIAAFVVVTVVLGDQAAAWYTSAFTFVNRNFGWFFVLAVNVYLFGLLAFGVSGFGTIRLGGPDAEPEFSTFSWLAMLFSSGMGVGLLFFGVAEPT
jgi:choline-glycine betaine transporter